MARYLASEMVRARCPCRPSPKCEITEAALPLSSFCQTVSVAYWGAKLTVLKMDEGTRR